jgi:hypothetical protein
VIVRAREEKRTPKMRDEKRKKPCPLIVNVIAKMKTMAVIQYQTHNPPYPITYTHINNITINVLPPLPVSAPLSNSDFSFVCVYAIMHAQMLRDGRQRRRGR